MSLLSTLSAASWRGYQALGGWSQAQRISFNYTSIGAVSGNGLYFAIREETNNSIDIYFYSGSSFAIQQSITSISSGTVSSIAMDNLGFYLAVGIVDASGVGSVNIYLRTGTSWSLQQTLTPSDTPQSQFGYSVSLTGDATRIVIGNYNSTTDTNQYGSFYVFTRSGTMWSQETKKQLTTLVAYDRLGTSVSINSTGDTIVAGAPSVFATTGTTGKVATFTRSGSTWTQQQLILRPAGANGRGWGTEVKMSADGTYFAGTCPDVGTPGVFGGIGLFNYTSTWTQTNYFVSPYSNDSFWYPGSVALTSDASFMYTAGDNGPVGSGVTQGFTYLRNNTTFSLSQTLTLVPATANIPTLGRVIGTNNDGTLLIILAFVNTVPNELFIFRNA